MDTASPIYIGTTAGAFGGQSLMTGFRTAEAKTIGKS